MEQNKDLSKYSLSILTQIKRFYLWIRHQELKSKTASLSSDWSFIYSVSVLLTTEKITSRNCFHSPILATWTFHAIFTNLSISKKAYNSSHIINFTCIFGYRYILSVIFYVKFRGSYSLINFLIWGYGEFLLHLSSEPLWRIVNEKRVLYIGKIIWIRAHKSRDIYSKSWFNFYFPFLCCQSFFLLHNSVTKCMWQFISQRYLGTYVIKEKKSVYKVLTFLP